MRFTLVILICLPLVQAAVAARSLGNASLHKPSFLQRFVRRFVGNGAFETPGGVYNLDSKTPGSRSPRVIFLQWVRFGIDTVHVKQVEDVLTGNASRSDSGIDSSSFDA